jgi:hypothetical protein
VQDVEVVIEIVTVVGFAAGLAKVHRRVPLLLQIFRPTVPLLVFKSIHPIPAVEAGRQFSA